MKKNHFISIFLFTFSLCGSVDAVESDPLKQPRNPENKTAIVLTKDQAKALQKILKEEGMSHKDPKDDEGSPKHSSKKEGEKRED